MRALQAGLAHESGRPLAAAAHAQLAEFGMNARSAVRPATLGMDGADARQQTLIGQSPR
jgi:hypothetical protein